MAVLTTASNVNENGTATDDVTSGSTTITRLLSYVDRAGVTQTNTAIPATPAGLTVLTFYGTLTIHQDGTYSYVANSPAADALDTGDAPTETFSYDFGDPTAIDDGTTTIVVNGVNDAPVAVPNTYTIAEDSGPFHQNAPAYLGNDTDVDDPAASLTSPTLVTAPLHGTWTALVDGSFTYTPDANYFGTDAVTVTVSDGEASVNETINFVITAVEDPYVAVDDGSDPGAPGAPGGFVGFYTFNEDATQNGTVAQLLANDSNPDGDPIDVQSISNLFDAVTGLQVGTVTYTAGATPGSGTFVIDSDPDYNGAAYFDYVAQNTTDPANIDTGRTYVTVTSVNDAPVPGINSSHTETEDQNLAFALPPADDTHGGAPGENNVPLTYQVVAGTVQRNGVTIADSNVTVGPGNTYTYNGQAADQGLDTGEHNTITFQYTSTDSLGGVSAPASETLTVTGVNDAPVAVNDFFTGAEDTPLPASPARNLITGTGETPPGGADTDVDGEPLTAVASSGTTTGGGTYQVFTDGSFSYTPFLDYNGTDTFTYTVTDGTAVSAPGTVSISVSPSADAPIANDDGPFSVTEDVPGQATGLAPGGGASRTNANGFFTEASLLANDTDPDGTTNDITSVGAAQGGTVMLYTSPGGTQYVVFTPFANYSGPAGFDYAVTDPTGNSDIGHVTLNVQEASDGGPVAVDDTLTATEQTVLHITAAQLVANDTDPDNANSGAGTDQLVIRAIQNIVNATLTNVVTDANGNIVSFDLTSISDVNGAPTSFDYVVDDAAARLAYPGDTAAPGAIGGIRTVGAPDTRSGTDIGSVTVNVTNVNDAPDAVNDTLPGTTEDSSTGVTFTAATLLANDHDPDNAGNTNAGLTATIPTGAVNGGTITFNSGTGVYTFIPSANFNGTATFNYTVTDTGGLTDTATVSIPVAAVNDAPVAVDDTLTRTITVGAPLITEDRDSTFSWNQLLANDTDVDNDTLSIVSATSPQGTVTVDPGTHTITFHPTPGYQGPATIDYVVDDGHGGQDVGTASFVIVDTIQGGNTAETLGGGAASIVVHGNGGDDTLNGTPQTDELYGDGGNDTLNGLGSDDYLRGGIGNDTANGNDGNDSIYTDDGGNDTSNGGEGSDGIYAGAALNAADVNNGGNGSDTLALRGNYGAAGVGNSYLFSASNLMSIEALLLASGTNTTMFPLPGGGAPGPFNYFLTEQDANVAAGQTLTIVAGSPAPGINGLQSNENLSFDGSDEKDGMFRIFAGQGTDNLIGGEQNDGFFFETGGFTGADTVNGRGGTDSLALRGNYSGGVTLTNVTNTENVVLLSGYNNPFGGALYGSPGGPATDSFDYNVTLAGGNVAAGGTLVVSGVGLHAGEVMTINGTNILGGNLTILAGAGNDRLSGGNQSTPLLGSGGTDLLYGGLGGDRMDGGSTAASGFGSGFDGSNVYMYRAAGESGGSQSGIDHILGFNYQVDDLDINAGGPATNGLVGGIPGLNVTDVNAVFNGTFTDTNANAVLDDSEFFTQLASQLDNALNPGQAAFLQVTSGAGGYTGQTIFVADTNGNGSVDSSDLIIVFENLQGQLPPTTEFLV